ncbi:hypothetical protein BCR39DRAFT_512961 [Naematelia encephala]|uniref:Uncharacterized protein n=1 Tax=Naematelia encephala TaxID=71784 RepID=A0A1Y2BMB5_9TREE|nr:hypothetical protein BCR39DRAFT_512961 [Naematelia encephala]
MPLSRSVSRAGAGLVVIFFIAFIIRGSSVPHAAQTYQSVRGMLASSSSSFSAAPRYVSLDEEMPESEYVVGVAGFNYFHNLYLHGGTYHFVTTNPSPFPDILTEKGPGYIMTADLGPDDDGRKKPPAGEDRWRVLDPMEAREIFGNVAIRKSGISMWINDAPGAKTHSFLNHYFHWEMFLGAWRVVAAAGDTDLPSRIMYRTTPKDWVSLTAWFQQAVLPDTLIEEQSIFEDRKVGGMTFLFDKISIVDRWAAHQKGDDVKYWNKATADLQTVAVPLSWMDPMRDSLKRLALADGCSVERQNPTVPIVSYINRQLTGRRLNADDAAELLVEMRKLHEDGVIEFYDAQMETLTRTRQIMFGVHGNGLSHQLWMKPGSGVMEIMNVGGFAKDYAMLAELMSHEYYAIHNDTTFPPEKWRRPDKWAVEQGPGFHGSNIRVDATFMANMVKQMAEARRGVVEPPLVY